MTGRYAPRSCLLRRASPVTCLFSDDHQRIVLRVTVEMQVAAVGGVPQEPVAIDVMTTHLRLE